jgi:hypothetical protein
MNRLTVTMKKGARGWSFLIGFTTRCFYAAASRAVLAKILPSFGITHLQRKWTEAGSDPRIVALLKRLHEPRDLVHELGL